MSCPAEVRWVRKYPRGMVEEISPRFNRRAPPPNHDKCGPNCRFWLRKKISYYYYKNKKLKKLIWKNGKKTNIESPYGLDFDLCNIWDISNVNTISEELEIYKKNLCFVKKDNKKLNRILVNIHRLIKESNLREESMNVITDDKLNEE